MGAKPQRSIALYFFSFDFVADLEMHLFYLVKYQLILANHFRELIAGLLWLVVKSLLFIFHSSVGLGDTHVPSSRLRVLLRT